MKDFLGESGDQLVNEDLASYIVIDNGGLLQKVIISGISVSSTHFVYYMVTALNFHWACCDWSNNWIVVRYYFPSASK